MRTLLPVLLLAGCAAPQGAEGGFRIATFQADVTPPIGHPLCGGMVAPAARVEDPLSARGVVILGPDEPVVVVAVDWTELRNETYERWRAAIADAAGTSPRRVLLSCAHQHDAPYADLGAQRRLTAAGLPGFHVDPAFLERAIQATAKSVRDSLSRPAQVTHLGTGEAEVERVACNRRVVVDGKTTFKRYSRTSNPAIRNAPDGLVDPKLTMLSFWDGDRALAALSFFAVHPMSHYGGGGVSADFPGLARSWRERALPGLVQVYFSGAAGDVTAAKYNTADAAGRIALAGRMEDGMRRAWEATRRHAVGAPRLRVSELRFELPKEGPGSVSEMERKLADPASKSPAKLDAALGLSWAERVTQGRPIDVAALDFGPAQMLLLPAEAFVEFQLDARRRRPDQVIAVAAYGECGPGYIPTESARSEGYVEEHGYCWVGPGAEALLKRAVADALGSR